MYHGGSWYLAPQAPAFFYYGSSQITFRNLVIIPVGSQISGIMGDENDAGQGFQWNRFENVGVAGFNSNGYGRPVLLKGGGFDYSFTQFTCDSQLNATQLPFPCVEFTQSIHGGIQQRFSSSGSSGDAGFLFDWIGNCRR